MGCNSSTEKVVAAGELREPVVGSQIQGQWKYTIGGELGKGAFSIVMGATQHGIDTNGNANSKVAIKCIGKQKMDPDDIVALKREVNILKEVNHPHIVNIIEFFEDNAYFYMVTEKMSGGELFDRIVDKTVYTEADARDLVKLLTSTILHLHKKHIVHRDLKPENLLLQDHQDDAHIKIADFGLAMVHTKSDAPMMQPCGSPGYVAPEIIADPPVGYDKSVDIWSIGVITYILLCGYPPFQADDQDELFDQIRAGSYTFDDEDWSQVSPEAISFIESTLVVNPKKRSTAEELLQHEWMTSTSVSAKPSPALAKLKVYNAKYRWKKAIQATVGVIKMKNAIEANTAAKKISGR
jgi:calcium/calmodulin-dependent protein kinase I